jgi:hypothetical protein
MIANLDLAIDPITCTCGLEIKAHDPIVLLSFPEQHPIVRPVCIECARLELLAWHARGHSDTDPAIARYYDDEEGQG